MHEEMQLVDSLFYMPMAEIPGFVVQHLFYRVQPMLRAVINGRLVYSRKKALRRNIFIWAGVGKYDIHGMCPALLLDILLDRGSRLLVRPPIVSHPEPIELVHAVSTADHNALLALNIKNVAVYREQDIREVLLVQHTTAMPLFFLIGADILRSVLMISVYAEKRGLHIAQFLLQQAITYLTSIIDTYITEQNDNILFCRLKPDKQIV